MNVTITNNSETFTFAEGMVDDINSKIATDIDQNVIPAGGPLNNLGIDINGVVKIITVTGNLFDTASTVSNTQSIRDKDVMKLWLEGLQDGNQQAKLFTSNNELFSVSGSGSSTIIDAITSSTINLTAVFTYTRVYVTGIDFSEENANPSLIPFTMTLWVAGS